MDVIRKCTRELVETSRKSHRIDESDFRRTLPTTTSSNLQSLATITNKLKTKSSISSQELCSLKNTLLEDGKHIETVLSTHGALRGLVRELTGSDVNKQCEAAGCLCNLALGDSRGCVAIAKAAGPYLVTCLENLSSQLCVTCAWALGNLAGNGGRVCDVLIAQGALTKLTYTMATSTSDDVVDSVIYAVTHFVYQLKDDLSQENYYKILEAASNKIDNQSIWHLLYLLSCHQDFSLSEDVTSILVKKVTSAMYVSMETLTTGEQNVHYFLFIVRTLANICVNNEMCSEVLHSFIDKNSALCFKTILFMDNESVNNSVLWLLGNLLQYSNDSETKNKFFNDLAVL